MPKSRAEKKADKDLLTRIRRRVPLMVDADRENRAAGVADMKFLRVPGFQWDDITKRERGADRPMYEFNKLNITAKRIVNDMRANRPMGKVRAAEDGDTETADVMEGLIRNIVANADFDTVTDYAAEYQVGAGMGAWRVTLEYAEDSFDQIIDIDPLLNPFCLYWDPAAKDLLKRDADDWWYTDKISRESYERRWPNAEVINVDEEFDDDNDWESENQVRIGEYWYKQPYKKTILLLSNGEVVDAVDESGNEVTPPEGVTVVRSREVNCNRIMMCIASGSAILEGPTEWAGSQHPWVVVFGEFVVIDGKTYWNGITRAGKDPQRAYNYSRTAAVEAVALAPQDKPWMTPTQIAGLEDHLAEAHKKNYPFNLYNPDPVNGGAPPQRSGGPAIPAALVQEMQISSDDIKAVTGIYDASLGAQGNETSGKAINARQRQGEIATYNYPDNMGKGVKRTWEIFVDLIPKVYDTERTVRVLGVDGTESYKKINSIDPATGKPLNDLRRAKFDTAITIGPSFATLRQEAAEAYTEIASRDPNLMLAGGDLVLKAMDLPYAQELAERYQALLPPPIQQMLQQGKTLPPEVTSAMAQLQQQQAMVEQHGQLVSAAEQELKELQSQVKGDAASAKLAQANVKAAEAELQAQLDSAKGELALAQQKLDNDRALFLKEVENSLLKIQNAQLKAGVTLANQDHQRDMEHMQREHDLETQHRDVQDTAKDALHEMNDHAQNMKTSQMQADHKQQMAKANKPKPKK